MHVLARTPWSDQRIDRLLGRGLGVGTLLSAVTVALGAAFYLVANATATTDYRVFRGEPADLRSLRGIAADAAAFNSLGIIQLGVLLLIATPIMRVALAGLGFLAQRDWVYVAIALTVLSLLSYGLVGGR